MATKEKSTKSDSKIKKKSGNTKVKTVREHVRHLKSGKVVKVRKYQAEYEAADELAKAMSKKEGAGKELEALKKKGAGDELEKLKKKKPVEKVTEEELSDFMELLDQLPSLKGNEESRNLYIRDFKKAKGKEGRQAEIDNLKWEIKEEKKNKRVAKADAKFAASLKSERNYGFTADDYKAWYHWDQDADPKNKSVLKVEKALKKQMGTKAYNKYFDEMTDSYSARGHNKAFKGLSETFGGKTDSSETASKGTKASKSEESLEDYYNPSLTLGQKIKQAKHNVKFYTKSAKEFDGYSGKMDEYSSEDRRAYSETAEQYRKKAEKARRDLAKLEATRELKKTTPAKEATPKVAKETKKLTERK